MDPLKRHLPFHKPSLQWIVLGGVMSAKDNDGFEYEEIAKPVELLNEWEEDATETIDLQSLSLNKFSETGSFVLSGIEKTAIGKLFEAIPTPIMLINIPDTEIRFVNSAGNRFIGPSPQRKNSPLFDLFTDDVRAVQDALNKLFVTRRHQTIEVRIMANEVGRWVRIRFRSLRFLGERFALLLMEDLTHEKEELSKKADALRRNNMVLREEVSRRKQTEIELRNEVVVRNKAETNLKVALGKTIRALSKISEMKDPHTAGHQRRVSQLAVAMADKMGLERIVKNRVAVASTVHDIGKINIPAEFLTKPGALNEHEYAIIREHPTIGYEVLRETQLPREIPEAVLQHHERMNGQGYPRGLKGESILLEARIISVADLVEAMSSHRPYREALRLSKATEELSKNKGILYDSRVVDACFAVLRDGFKFQ